MVNVEPTLTWLPLLPALLAPVSISGTNLLAYEVNASNAIRAASIITILHSRPGLAIRL